MDDLTINGVSLREQMKHTQKLDGFTKAIEIIVESHLQLQASALEVPKNHDARLGRLEKLTDNE